MRKRLAFAAAITALVFVAAISAASSAGQTSSRGAVAKGPSGTVTLSGWTSGSGVEGTLLKKVLVGFARKYPKIHVKYTAVNGDYPATMLAKFSARKPPDVFYVDSNVAPDWMSQGALEPLDKYIKKNKFSTKPFFPRLLDAFRYKGHIYGLPKDWSPLGMETNNAMLAKAGVKPPTTWGQLRAAAVKLNSSGAVSGGKPICLSGSWDRLLAFVYQNKGALLNGAKTKSNVQSPAVKAAVNYYVGLIKDGLAATPDKLGVDWCGAALGKEKAAIIFEGNWVVPYMHDSFPDVSYKISPLPKGKTRGNLAFTVSYSMARDSKNKDAAWTLISYLTGQQGMQTWTSLGLALPARSDVTPAAGRSAFLKGAGYSHAWQFAPQFAKVIDVANNELTAVIQGKESVEAMLKKIADAANSALHR